MTFGRKVLSICVAMTCLSFCAAAQKEKDFSAVVNNHSISISTIGAEYGYEQRLGGWWSIIGRAGIVTSSFDVSSSPDHFNANFSMAMGITVEPRYYTSFSRRLSAGKPTVNNSSDFIAIRMQGLSDGERGFLSLIPMYGIRRHGGKHWYHEFTLGARLSAIDAGFDITPHVQYRLGFIF